MFKRICSCSGPGSNSQQLHVGSHLSITPEWNEDMITSRYGWGGSFSCRYDRECSQRLLEESRAGGESSGLNMVRRSGWVMRVVGAWGGKRRKRTKRVKWQDYTGIRREAKLTGWTSLGWGSGEKNWEEPRVLSEPNWHFGMFTGTTIIHLSQVSLGPDILTFLLMANCYLFCICFLVEIRKSLSGTQGD